MADDVEQQSAAANDAILGDEATKAVARRDLLTLPEDLTVDRADRESPRGLAAKAAAHREVDKMPKFADDIEAMDLPLPDNVNDLLGRPADGDGYGDGDANEPEGKAKGCLFQWYLSCVDVFARDQGLMHACTHSAPMQGGMCDLQRCNNMQAQSRSTPYYYIHVTCSMCGSPWMHLLFCILSSPPPTSSGLLSPCCFHSSVTVAAKRLHQITPTQAWPISAFCSSAATVISNSTSCALRNMCGKNNMVGGHALVESVTRGLQLRGGMTGSYPLVGSYNCLYRSMGTACIA